MTEITEYQGDGVLPGRAQNVVRLGEHEYTLVPQPHALILRKFPQVVQGTQDLQDVDLDSMEDFMSLVGNRAHDALRIFIPNLMPLHEFLGFSTNAAMDAGEFDEEFAKTHTPTLPEVFHAFDVGMTVNGGKRLKDVLGNVLGPEVTRAVRSFLVVQMRQRLSEMSLNSPSTNGGSSPSTSSGQSDQTPEDLEGVVSEVSPSPVS